MRRSLGKTAHVFVLTLSVASIISACGLSELLGRQEKKTIVMPCLELIPTPTPTPVPSPTPVPIPTPGPTPAPPPTSTPESSLEPTPQPTSVNDCSDGPGTAVICNGQVLSTAQFIILPAPIIPTPTPTPSTPPPTPTPPAPTGIVLYATNDLYNGDLGGLSGANSICSSTSSRPPGYSQYIAFISEDIGNAIADFPTRHGVPTDLPVLSLSNNQVAADWADLLGPPLGLSLYEAGVLPANSTWWSGSDSDGGLSWETCADWTDAFPPEEQGSYGGSDYTDTRWVSLGTDDCNIERYVLCLAYNGTPPPLPTEVLVDNSVACGTFSDSCGVYSNLPCCTINEAMSIAFAYDVDRIYVEDNSGPYTEQIFLYVDSGNSLTIEAGANVELQVSGSEAVYSTGPGAVTIRNFQLTADMLYSLMYVGDGSMTLENNNFTGMMGAAPASALYIDDSFLGTPTVFLDGNSFSDSSTSGNVIACTGGSLSSAGNNAFSSGGAGISTTLCETGAFTCTFSCPAIF